MTSKRKIGTNDVYLTLQNNTPVNQNVVLFDVPGAYNSQNSIMQSVKYSYDFTADLLNAATFNSNSLVVVARNNSVGSPYVTYVATQNPFFQNVDQVLSALNSLNIGLFFKSIGNTVVTYSSELVFSSISITNTYIASLVTSASYVPFGTFVYDEGYTTGGVGIITQIDTSVPFWINSPPNNVNGPMNREAVWNPTIPLNQWIGQFYSVYMQQPGVVYVGIASDNIPAIYVNNELAVQFDTAAMLASIVAQYPVYSFVAPDQVPFYFWHIFPIQLPAGTSVIQFQNENTSGTGTIAVEIYNNTKSQLLASTGYSDLDVLFKSSSLNGGLIF
jgi:hypothetical protein